MVAHGKVVLIRIFRLERKALSTSDTCPSLSLFLSRFTIRVVFAWVYGVIHWMKKTFFGRPTWMKATIFWRQTFKIKKRVTRLKKVLVDKPEKNNFRATLTKQLSGDKRQTRKKGKKICHVITNRSCLLLTLDVVYSIYMFAALFFQFTCSPTATWLLITKQTVWQLPKPLFFVLLLWGQKENMIKHFVVRRHPFENFARRIKTVV